MKKHIDKNTYLKICRLSSQGITLVILTFLGLIIGIKLDDITGMIPNFMLLFLIGGILLGIRGFYLELFKP